MNWHKFTEMLPILSWDEYKIRKESSILLLYSSKEDVLEFGMVTQDYGVTDLEVNIFGAYEGHEWTNTDVFDYWCYEDEIPKPK